MLKERTGNEIIDDRKKESKGNCSRRASERGRIRWVEIWLAKIKASETWSCRAALYARAAS
jgi:hypothetical protein